MIELGKMAEDKITGFQGIIVGHARYLTGCDQYVLAPRAKRGEGLISSQWFDEGRIKILKGGGISAKEVSGTKNGGPNRDAPNK